MNSVCLPVILLTIIFSPLLKFVYFGGLDELKLADVEKMKRSARYRALTDATWALFGFLYVVAIVVIMTNDDNGGVCHNPLFAVLSFLVLLSFVPPFTMASMCLIIGSIGALCDLIIFLPIGIFVSKLKDGENASERQ